MRVTFPAIASNAFVAEGEGVRVVLSARGSRAARAEVEDGAVAYRAVYRDTDALHVAKPDWTEEYLHLRSPRAPRRFEYEIAEAVGATRVFLENGQVHFLDDSGRGLVALAPVVVDAIGRRSATAAAWKLETVGAARHLTLNLNPDGLEYPLLVDPTWITTGSLNTARLDGIGILLHNGKVLVMAGAPNNQQTSEVYDPATGIWTPAGAVGQGRAFFAAVMLRDGRVLLTGGSSPGGITRSCRFFDPGTGTWAPAPGMNSPRESHTATLLADGRVLVAGGQNPLNNPLASAEIFDPVANTWTLTGSMVNAHRSHATALLTDGRVLVAGGVTLPGPSTTKVSEVFDPGSGIWTRVGDLGAFRSAHSATLLPDGRVLAAGGSFGVGTAEIYNPATGLWSPTAPLLTARGEHSATLLPNGRVVVAGGGSLTSSELYNPGSGTWTAGPSMATGRFRHAATMLPDGRVLVAGGFGGVTLATAELLDVDAPFWTATNPMTTARSEATVTVLKSGKVLVTGAVGSNTAEVYDPTAASWTPTANSLADSRSRHTATALVNGRVLVAGGQGLATGSAELYDPPTNGWLPTGAMSGRRYYHTATLLPCGEVLVAGGESSSGVVLASAERYNPRTGTWRPTGALNQVRWRHTATLLKDGRVLVTGGFGGGAPRTTAEIYDPVTESWTLTAGSMSIGRYHHRATLLPSGKVLVTGGQSAGTSAQLFDPASGLFTGTGATTFGHDTDATATLLPNGRVLAVGGFANPRKAEVYDPAVGVWTAVPDALNNRDRHVAALLPDGRVLLAGGIITASAEIYDVGRGENPAWRPLLFTATDPLVTGTPLTVGGNNMQGLGEGSTGLGYMHSATNYPLVQLRRLDNDLVSWVPVEPTVGWSKTSFGSRPVTGIAPGLAIATVFTNGIPSVSKGLSVECPAPTVTTPPTSQTVCQGAAASFTVATTGECPTYQWRRNGTPLTDGGPYSGTATSMLTIAPAGPSEVGSYDVQVSLACSSTVVTSSAATLSLNPPIGAVDASIAGPASVCTTCLGGTASESHTGGGAVSHQWGFRTVSGGPITDIPFATAPTYVLNGADFPGLGSYFLVVKANATCGGLVISDEVPVTVDNAAGPTDEVPFFTVTSRDARNVLEWVYPSGFTGVRIRYTTGLPCVYPSDGDTSGTWLVDKGGAPGGRDSHAHDPVVNGTTYCYTVFVDKAGTWSTGRTNSGKPFPTTGPLKWAFHSGVFSTTAPTVGGAGVIGTNNANAVHAMSRGAGGGEWPAGWKPALLGGAVQNRSPIVPITVGGSNPVVFLGAQDGNVYALDATVGAAAASPPWPAPAPAGGLVQAAPAGIFTAFSGAFSYLLVGTREGSADNVFRAFDPTNGSVVATFDNSGGSNGIGIISSQAAVDYATSRVYFTSRARAGGSPNTLWCLQLGPPPTVFTLAWARGDLGDIGSAPVLRGGRVYVGTTVGGGTLYSIDAANGNPLSDRTFLHGDGPVKGFVFPDRNSPTGDLYFAANTRVWGVTEIAGVLANKFGAGIALPGGAVPSTLLLQPGSHYIYVGGNDGWLYQIDTLQTPPTADFAAQLGASPLTLGAPSLDRTNGLVHIGSATGTFFAVGVPVAPLDLCTANCAGKPAGMACTTTAPPCMQTCDGVGNCN